MVNTNFQKRKDKKIQLVNYKKTAYCSKGHKHVTNIFLIKKMEQIQKLFIFIFNGQKSFIY